MDMGTRQYKVPERLMKKDYFNSVKHFSIAESFIDFPFPIHCHEFFEMEFIFQGRGTHVVNGNSYPLAEGMLFLMTPADFHEVIPEEGTTIHLANIKFSDEVIRDEIRGMLVSDDKYMCAAFIDKGFAGIEGEIRRLREEYVHPGIGSDFIIKGGLERLLIDLIRNSGCGTECKKASLETNGRDALQKAFIYIYHHFRENIRLEDAAEKSNLSANYFSECFHKAAGISFQNYLLGLRLEFARTLLSASRLPVTEVCFASGFNSLPYFIRKFKKAYGVPPGTFRSKTAEHR